MTDATDAQALVQEAMNAVLKDYVLVFSSVEGQRVLRHIEFTSYVHESTAVAGDPYGTHFREGMRIGALNIKRRIERGQLVGTIEEPRAVTPSIPHEEGA